MTVAEGSTDQQLECQLWHDRTRMGIVARLAENEIGGKGKQAKSRHHDRDGSRVATEK
jgi:hypothetical protein